ncbi:deoxyribodipyrimidine photo-lyase [Pedobacter sp. ASV28]|uniref:cryptochrome/photolyase family protein n=1 Tax=Pedobacter sp. ASV28 TaxID=2795123 RepID=UPI0018EACD06|nr:deoxyribodipyrimidine photo-lyase [Pedobacter sp. ASV28]
MRPKISVCWLRRDLRLNDHAALYHALKSGIPVLVVFIFDKNILEKLNAKTDARVSFIYQVLDKLNKELVDLGSSLFIKFATPKNAWLEILKDFEVKAVYTNHDYEPYAQQRDEAIAELLGQHGISFHTYKDQVIFEKDELTKADGKPYSVFTPYYKQWLKKLNSFYVKAYPTQTYFGHLYQTMPFAFPELQDFGFMPNEAIFPAINYQEKIDHYDELRDYPAKDATTHLGLHLRFGTVSIREVVAIALEKNVEKWLSELVWREFYMMILWHFPHTVTQAFKPDYDKIQWRNNEKEFKSWCEGETGYPLVDAGMRQLNKTGFMHNRVRMVVASFLCKHLLIDWRWGEAYFADKLLDYEQASNVGGWQWACGSGNDAAPYFRVFNPELQLKKFDPKMEYVFKWAPQYQLAIAPMPIVDHNFARERALKVYKTALNEKAS